MAPEERERKEGVGKRGNRERKRERENTDRKDRKRWENVANLIPWPA